MNLTPMQDKHQRGQCLCPRRTPKLKFHSLPGDTSMWTDRMGRDAVKGTKNNLLK